MIRPQYPEGFPIVEMDGGWYVPEYFDKQQGIWQHFDTNRPLYFVWHKFHKQGAAGDHWHVSVLATLTSR